MRPRFRKCFTKLRVFELEEYQKVVLLDTILSPTDSWTYVLQLVSNRALASALHWSCAECPSSWLLVLDFFLDAASKAYAPPAEWMSILGMTEFPGSWLHATNVITSDTANLAP
mmetsp:Transcript_45677/g.102503  ORF Transcript_45677/g.102503 Transcript_45677/m.102503 type:complete len:114 (-) Transcript_45677:106-447(-)